MNKCRNCDQLVHASMAVIDEGDVFCSEHCASAYGLKSVHSGETARCGYCHSVRKKSEMIPKMGMHFCSYQHWQIVKNR